MPIQASSQTAVSSRVGKVRPPKLDDSSRFVKVDSIPIIDTFERVYHKTDKHGNRIKVEESVDEDQLQVILDNSRLRSEKGEYGLLLIGHTDDDGREIDQPPTVGYVTNYQMGTYDGNPTILADLYLDREEGDPSRTLRQFPRRSAEILGIEHPKGYIDSVSLIKRTPERNLGLVTSHFSNKSKYVSRFECPACEREKMVDTLQKREARENSGKMKKDVTKNAMKLLEQLVYHIIEEQVENDPESHSESHEETSDSSGDPSMATTSRHSRSRFKKNEAHDDPSPSDPSEEGMNDASDDTSDPSGYDASEPTPSEPSSATPKMKKGKMHKKERMDPSEPSRMHKKSKMDAGGGMGGDPSGAGTPGTMTNMPSGGGDPSTPVVKTKVKSEPARMSRRTSEDDRMRRDSESISVSRLSRQIQESNERAAKLQERLDAADARARTSGIERRVIQLEAEGYELDRADEVARLSKIASDEDVDLEISRMRKHYKQSPVNQSMIPSFSEDMGGQTVSRMARQNDNFSLDPLPEEDDPRKPGKGLFIIGSHLARFAKKNKIESENGKKNSMETALDAVSRFRESKLQKTNV